MDKERIIRDYRYYLTLERRMSPNTVASYVSDIDAFLEQWKDRRLEGISREDILSYLSEVAEKGLSKRSQARLMSALRSFFKWTVMEGDRKTNPCDGIETPKLGRYLPAVLSVDEVNAILESVDPHARNGLRDRALLETLYGCGLRVSEAASLKISDLFFEEGFVRIIGKGNKQRIVPLGEVAAEAIRSYLDNRDPAAAPEFEDFLFLNRFGKPLSRIAIFNLVKQQALAAGIRKEISPHTFRHSFATHLIENGADLRIVQEMLGHESILTTEIYTHIEKSVWQNDILSHHPRKKG